MTQMSRAGRFARDNLARDTRDFRGELWQDVTTELQTYAIGRFVLDEFVEPQFFETTTYHDYLEEISEKNANKAGVNIAEGVNGEPFIPIISAEDFLRLIINNHPANQSTSMRKSKYEIRKAVDSIRGKITDFERHDRARSEEKVGVLREMYAHHLDTGNEYPHPHPDDADFRVWDEITVGLRPKRRLIDEHTVGFAVQHDSYVHQSNEELRAAINNAGYGRSLTLTNPSMEYLLPTIETETNLSSAADNSAPIVSDPPNYIRLGPIVLIETV